MTSLLYFRDYFFLSLTTFNIIPISYILQAFFCSKQEWIFVKIWKYQPIFNPDVLHFCKAELLCLVHALFQGTVWKPFTVSLLMMFFLNFSGSFRLLYDIVQPTQSPILFLSLKGILSCFKFEKTGFSV